MGNILIIFGLVMAIFGVLVNLFGKLKAPLLPGDILIQKENLTFYFPIATSIILSLIFTILFNLMRK